MHSLLVFPSAVRILVLLASLQAYVYADTVDDVEAKVPDGLVVCGMSEVFEVSLAGLTDGEFEKRWSWRAAERPELPKQVADCFATTDECKPVTGDRLLVTSSSGGCALIDRRTGYVSWYAVVPNAHSIELLPDNRVVVASSTAVNGNRLVIFDLTRSVASLWDTELHSAHGVVWDNTRKRLWALGFDELRCYRLKDWETASPSLELEDSFPLPNEGGHDLQSSPTSDDLVLSTHDHVYLFGCGTKQFRLHPALGDQGDVKSISIDKSSGRTVWLKADQPNWWTDQLRLLDPDGHLKLRDEKLYKARWVNSLQK